MSTTDEVDRYQPCPCDCGKIRITECSPDHPYARNSQTWYTAEIICDTCIEKYQIRETQIDDKRYIILGPNNPGEKVIKLTNIDMFCRGLTK
ncbi:MAG: hypothetical protein KKD92_00980 [Proteobacteria bacterium]|nr:hypothetical protein [Pseudomonadota bacterium]